MIQAIIRKNIDTSFTFKIIHSGFNILISNVPIGVFLSLIHDIQS